MAGEHVAWLQPLDKGVEGEAGERSQAERERAAVEKIGEGPAAAMVIEDQHTQEHEWRAEPVVEGGLGCEVQRDQDALSRILTGLDELETAAALSSRPGERVDLVDLARPAT